MVIRGVFERPPPVVGGCCHRMDRVGSAVGPSMPHRSVRPRPAVRGVFPVVVRNGPPP